MSDYGSILFIVEFSAGAYLVALVLGYRWTKAMHYPFTLRQRKMWIYYVLIISAGPILATLMVAMGLWLLPINDSVAITIVLLIAWIVIAAGIVRRMEKPGGRLSQERQESPDS